MKRAIIVLVIMSLCMPLFAGGAREAEAEVKTVRMWTFLNPEGATSGRNLALRRIIENFEAENPDIRIVVEPQQWDVMTSQFFAAHRAGNAPDIQWVISYDLGSAIEQGALQDLQSLFLDDWTQAEVDDIDDAFFRWGETDGKNYQITFSRNYFSLIYRKDLFEKHGISLPLRSWDGLVQAAVQLTGVDQATGIDRYGLGQAYGLGKIDPPIFVYDALTHQDDIFHPDGRANWTTPQMVRALERMSEMVHRYQITPEAAVTYDIEDVYQDFMAGRYAMMTGASVRIPALRAGANFDPSTIELMHYPGDGSGDFGQGMFSGWAVGVWSGSQVKDEAGRFLEYMASSEADELWVLEGGQVPMRKSTIERLSDFFADPANDYLRTTAEGFANYTYVTPTSFTISGWREDMNLAAQEVIMNRVDPRTALQRVERDFNDRYGR